MTFKNIRAGDRVRFFAPAGLRVIKGRAYPERRPSVGTAQHLLIFADHVVVNRGRGQPAVVDASNYISHTEVRPRAFDCPLCGQRITDGRPCGCGARS